MIQKLCDYSDKVFCIDEKPKDIFYHNQKIGSAISEYVLGDHPKNIDDDLNQLLMQNQILIVLAHTFGILGQNIKL